MRVPNGAKMDPKSALFLRVKIMRIHCKKQGLGSQNPFFPGPKLYLFYFFQKSYFSQSSISPRQEHYFSGLRTYFS